MSYRKLISALVFVAFGFCFSETARAQDCNNPDFCFDFGIPVTVDNITGSSITCDLQPGGASEPFNNLDIGSGLGTSTATFTQTGTAKCTQVPDVGAKFPLGTCAFNLTMTRVTTSSCDTESNSFNASLRCQDIVGGGGPTLTSTITPTVTGTITCPPGSGNVINLGVAGITGTGTDTCENVFPAGNGLLAGQVLDLTVTTKGQCQGAYVSISSLKERYCNGGFVNGPVDCTPIEGPTRTTNPATTILPTAMTFDFDVRQTVNTKPCKGPNDQGNANIDILGSNSFDVADMNVSSVRCEGAPLFQCMTKDTNHDGIPDLACKVNTCPTFGPALGKLEKNPDGRTVTAICTGLLKSGQAIQGLDDVRVTP